MDPSRQKILCIEDDAETAALVAEELAQRGFQVSLANNGQEGLSAILRWQPDLVLCDVNMPVMSGFEVLQRLTAIMPRFGQMPFVFLTAVTDRDSELKGWHLGADGYFTKPIDFDLLNVTIRARLAHVASSEVQTTAQPLNDHEVDSLTWAARGRTSAEIAQILGMKKRTVDFHIDNARAKLKATTRIEAIFKALSGRLIAP
jgi:DNA-binding response OmpR family regulator